MKTSCLLHYTSMVLQNVSCGSAVHALEYRGFLSSSQERSAVTEMGRACSEFAGVPGSHAEDPRTPGFHGLKSTPSP